MTPKADHLSLLKKQKGAAQWKNKGWESGDYFGGKLVQITYNLSGSHVLSCKMSLVVEAGVLRDC